MGKKYNGSLCAFSEMGSEGFFDLILLNEDEEDKPYILIEEDDYLTILETDNSVIFDGKIIIDKFYNQFKLYGTWIQQGCSPEKWLLFFFNNLRARLIKKSDENEKSDETEIIN